MITVCENPLPVPDPTVHRFKLVLAPGKEIEDRLWARIESLFGCRLEMELTDALEKCAGAIYIGNEDFIVTPACAKVLDFFYARDGREALVYRYRPREQEFYLIPKSWLDLRRES